MTALSRLVRRRVEIGLALASLIGTVGLLEVLARIYYAATYRPVLQVLAEHSPRPPKGQKVVLGDILRPSPDPKIVFEMKPNLDVQFVGVPLVTNAQGWRERELAEPKGARTVRIIGIGDSFMFGWGVPEADRYMNVLERALNQGATDVRFETATFAVPGYNLPMEVEVLKRYGLATAPDLIIYGYFDNDYCLPNFVAARKSLWSAESFLRLYLSGGINEWRGLLISRDSVISEAEADFEARYCVEGNTQPEYRDLVGKAHYHAALSELARIGRSLGIPVVFLRHLPCDRFDGGPIPEGIVEVDPSPDYGRYLQAHGYANLSSSDLVRGPLDPHPSRLGHQLIGALMHRELTHRGIVQAILDARRK